MKSKEVNDQTRSARKLVVSRRSETTAKREGADSLSIGSADTCKRNLEQDVNDRRKTSRVFGGDQGHKQGAGSRVQYNVRSTYFTGIGTP
jgi:hypothetical protein